MIAHEHLRELSCSYGSSGDLMSSHGYGAMESWVLMSSQSPLVTCFFSVHYHSWVLLSTYQCSFCHDHEYSWRLMSALEGSWVLVSDHELLFRAEIIYDPPWALMSMAPWAMSTPNSSWTLMSTQSTIVQWALTIPNGAKESYKWVFVSWVLLRAHECS